jgi:lysophospholipase L1-like esterase
MFTIIVIVVTIALCEIVSRIVLHFIYNRNFDFSIVEKNKYGSSNGLKANQTTSIWGQVFTTDQLGSRPGTPVTAKRKRVFIGDSVLEGVGLEDSTVCTALLQKVDATKQILNLSMAGNSSADYANIIDAIIDSTKPTYIHDVDSITVVFCLNDIYGKLAEKELPVMSSGFMAKCNSLLQNIGTYKLLKLLIYQHSDKYFQYDLQFYKQEQKVHESIDYLVRAKNKCALHQIKLEVLLLPYRSQFDSKNLFPQQTLAYYLGMNGVPFRDLYPLLAQQKDTKALYLFADEIHFSASGHKAIAAAILGK